MRDEAEIAKIQRLIQKRAGKPGFTANVEALNARLAEIQSNV